MLSKGDSVEEDVVGGLRGRFLLLQDEDGNGVM